MTDDDLKRDEVAELEPIIKNPEVEVLPPVLREIPHTRHHVKNEQLGLQIRDLSRLGLSKSSTALAARLSTHLLEKYYLEEFLEGQAEMQRGLASVAVAEAMNGNTPVLLHLLKTKLGWSEQHQIEISGEVRSVVSSKPLTKEEFIQRYLDKE
tara:strand:- start:634 stop:1092 length:459 start_codon:yes stop_codon:yes gene_type:complete